VQVARSAPIFDFWEPIMPFRVFAVPATDDGPNAEVLNAFLRTVRVVSVERQLVTLGQQTLWTFCVEYLEAGRAASPGGNRDAMKTDYREKLAPDTLPSHKCVTAKRAPPSPYLSFNSTSSLTPLCIRPPLPAIHSSPSPRQPA
jgi:hypothetical protein